MEYRQGPHPKKDYLIWKTPPTRQLSQQKRQEFELDVTERFYDDYMGARNTGDSYNEVLTGVHKLGFDPDLYKKNALHNLAYDPSRPTPKGINYHQMIKAEDSKEQERLKTQMRQRRLSDSMILQKPYPEYSPFMQQKPLHLPQVQPLGSQYQHSIVHQNTDEGLNPEILHGVNEWMAKASQKDRNIAAKFMRTITSQGQREDPATKASTHTSRVRSAIMTPSRQLRQDRETAKHYRSLERTSKDLPQPSYSGAQAKQKVTSGGSKQNLKRSQSDVAIRGSVFTATRQYPSHFTVHPEWASEQLKK
jgi:hypothetical protein